MLAHPTRDAAEARAGEARGGRLSALIYDPFLWWGERAGMAERRRGLVSLARGSVLELGAGTGLNLDHYPDGLDRLVMAEPEPNMVKRLEQRRERLGRRAEIVRAAAEALPFADDSFDTVVSTMVLCTVPDPTRALDEVRRVLRPDGSLLFVEHVRSDDPGLARWQDRLHGAWHGFADGCNCNRQTADLLRGAGYVVSLTERADWRRMPRIVRPLIIGSATPARWRDRGAIDRRRKTMQGWPMPTGVQCLALLQSGVTFCIPKHARRAVQNKDAYLLCKFSSAWPSKSADAQNALGRHSRTLRTVASYLLTMEALPVG